MLDHGWHWMMVDDDNETVVLLQISFGFGENVQQNNRM
jgi:hypothetical protein